MTDVIEPNELASLERKAKPEGVSRRGLGVLGLAAGMAATGAMAAVADVEESDVNVKTPDGVCDAALFRPKGKGAWPCVVMFPDAFGLRRAFREMGRRLASSGYVVLVPNPFYRSGHAPLPAPGFNFSNPDDRAKLAVLRKPMTPDAVASDAKAFYGFLDTQTFVNRKAKAGVVGYCMGGPMTMQAAAALPGRVGGACSFHGGGLVTDKPDSPHLLIPKIKARFYFGVAANDDATQPTAKDVLKAGFDAAHNPATVVVYAGCNHGWCPPDGGAYNKDGAERAWAEMLKLYGAALV